MEPPIFPPYGELDRGYKEGVNPKALAPPAWRPDLSVDQRESSWLEWRGKTLALINGTLWPQWDEHTVTWKDPDFARMLALTRSAFDLFDRMNRQRILFERPLTPVSSVATPTHFDYFQDEDSGLLGTRYNYYDITLPYAQLTSLISYKNILDMKAGGGSVSLQFKRLIQRPRAYQVARLLGKSHHYERAATSTTPSMSSGHCFQVAC